MQWLTNQLPQLTFFIWIAHDSMFVQVDMKDESAFATAVVIESPPAD
jgi:hypothetical protein